MLFEPFCIKKVLFEYDIIALMRNIAFIDGQNLHMGTKSSDPSWRVDLVKFRKYLQYKYKVDEAYYFLGYVQDENEEFMTKFKKQDLY